jgi:uncharacterized protein YjbJ (UPF0337 family)
MTVVSPGLVAITRGYLIDVHAPRPKGDIMSGIDKLKNKIEDLGGKGKEAAGRVTGDRDTEAEGRRDQSKADFKDAGEKVKDAFKH